MTAIAMAGQDISLIAGEDLSSQQFHFVKSATTDFGVLLVTNATTSVPIGVLQDDPDASGKAATVRVSGNTKVVAGGTVTRGNTLTLLATGEVQNKSGSDTKVGVALESGVTGDVVSMVLHIGLP